METETGYGGAGGGQGKARKRISPWVWVGCGCGALVLIAVLAVGGFIFATVRKVKDMEALQQDPKALAARIQQIVPYRDLPAGYSPAMVMDIPIFSQTAIFTRPHPAAAGESEEPVRSARERLRGGDQFIYSRTFAPNGGVSTEEQRKRFLDQRQGIPSWLKGLPIPIPDLENTRTGTFKVGQHTVYYRTQRGRVAARGGRRGFLMTLGIIDCADPMHTHTVMWSSAPRPQEAPASEDGDRPAEVGPSAEAGDPAAMAEFLGHFQLCGGISRGSG